MNILFLTAATGGGHIKTAQAVMQQMEQQLPGCKTRLADTLKYISPLVDRLVTGTYLNTIEKYPNVYGWFYDLSEKNELITDLVKGFNYALARRLLPLFEQFYPDVVICTHTMPLQMLSYLKLKKLLHIPVIGIVTDYTSHFFWKLNGVDAFITANEYIKWDMVKMGIGEERIYPLGIPVAESFLSVRERLLLLKKMGFEDKPTILLMGGSLGYGGLQSVFMSLLNLQRDIQIIAVTGCNTKLKLQLEEHSRLSTKTVKILGYTEKISELMDMADLLITKPGGITVTEALVKRLPCIIITPIPGQEERNARFLTDSGAATRLQSCEDIDALLNKTLDQPAVLARMSEAAKRLANPNACKDITLLAESLAKKTSYAKHVSIAAKCAEAL